MRHKFTYTHPHTKDQPGTDNLGFYARYSCMIRTESDDELKFVSSSLCFPLTFIYLFFYPSLTRPRHLRKTLMKAPVPLWLLINNVTMIMQYNQS